MSSKLAMPSEAVTDPASIRARSKVLAREHYEMRADLVRLRRERGLRQKDVADRMGVSQQAVNKLERYDSDPKLSTLRRYANAVGAMIEHRVTPDLGQAVERASIPIWEPLRTITKQFTFGHDPSPASAARESWTEGTRSNFALAS